jgi:hypothetical protein
VLTNREFFGGLAAKEIPPFEIEWANLVKGWGEVSNDAIRQSGFQFEITTPYFKETDQADMAEAVRRLCLPMRDCETGRFTPRGCHVDVELPNGARVVGHLLFGMPFLQELSVKSAADEQERVMTRMLGVMQRGRDEHRLLMHYYQLNASNDSESDHASDRATVIRASDIGELLYTLELQYDVDQDCYRGDQRYDVKLRHLIGMMPADVVKKIFSKDKKDAPTDSQGPKGMPMPQAEWHMLELYPTHTMYMHAFLANKSDQQPLPMMGMQKPYRFEYL